MQHDNNRITIKSLLQQAWHTISHVEKGLRSTLVALAAKPGKMIKDYIHGNRKPFQTPFSFLLIVTTVYALLLYWIHFDEDKTLLNNPNPEYHTRFIMMAGYLQSKFYSWLHVGLLPFYGVISLLIFRQVKYNWAEWMVACCYIISFILILLIPYQVIALVFNFSNTVHFYIQLVIIASYSNLVMTDLIPGKLRLLIVLQTLAWCIAIFLLFLYTVQLIAWLLTI